MSLKKLIKSCKKQDRDAQKALYLQFADLAMNIGRRYAKDEHEAKDIVQNAFIKIFTKIEDFKFGQGTFEGWVSRIVVNEALQMYRTSKRIYFNGSQPYDKDVAVAAEAIETLEAEDILNLLKQLPNGYRLVFNMYVVEGYKHKEIAALLGISESASRSQLTRAKKLLKRMILEQNALDHANFKRG